MARHSPFRFSCGVFLASQLPLILRSSHGGNEHDKAMRAEAAKAVGHIDAGDITEHTRAEIYACARVMLALAPLASKGDALALYAESLVSFIKHNEYSNAQDQATRAAAMASTRKAA